MEADFRPLCFLRMGRSFPIGYFTALLSGSQHCRTVYCTTCQSNTEMAASEKIHMDTPKLRDLPQYLPAQIQFLFASLPHHFPVKLLDGSRINVNSKCKSIPCTLGARCTEMSVATRIEFLTSFGFLTRLRATCLPRTPQIILVLQKRPCEAWEGAGSWLSGFETRTEMSATGTSRSSLIHIQGPWNWAVASIMLLA